MRSVRTFLLAALLSTSSLGLVLAQQPHLVIDADPSTATNSSGGRPFGSLGDIFLAGIFVPTVGSGVWRTTGTPASSTMFLQPPPPSAGEGLISGVGIELNGAALFTYAPSQPDFPPPQNTLAGLWTTDATTAGTQMVKRMGIYSGQMASYGGLAFFAGDDAIRPMGENEDELWRTDGTRDGTFLLKDLVPGSPGSFPGDFTSMPDGVLFSVKEDFDGRKVWRTDGTPEGTRRVTTIHCLPALDRSRIVRVGARAFMLCTDAAHGEELWVTGGTPHTTRMVMETVPGPTSYSLWDLVDVEGTLFFGGPALDPGAGGTLWKSDGTEAGTAPVDPSGPFMVSNLTSSNGLVFYIAYTPASGYELWRSDGTPAGTFMLRDIWPGPDGGVPPFVDPVITAVPGGVVFTARTLLTGNELWRSDGTTAGTVPFDEIEPGPSASDPTFARTVGAHVYFDAFQTGVGRALWAIELPAAVRVEDASVVEGDSSRFDAIFPVSLNAAAAGTVTVDYATVAGTATAGTDFIAQSGTLTFRAGSVGPLYVTVPVSGDLHDEPNEDFTVELSGITGAIFQDRRAVGAIVDDDFPTITAGGDVTVTEGNAGTTPAVVTLTLVTSDGQPSDVDTLVSFETEAVTAGAGSDFVAQSGVLTFAAGTPSGATATVTVPVVGDTADEPDEIFRVRFEPMEDEVLPVTEITARIVDDDGVTQAAVELSHGAGVRATLTPLPGRGNNHDWYALRQAPLASYEAVVDEVSGDAVPLQLERMAAGGSTVLQTAAAVGVGSSVSLRWQNFASTAVSEEHLRVSSAACGTGCGDDDRYRIRLYETTLAAARFNSSGGQVTVVLLQNPTNATIQGYVRTWDPTGTLTQQVPFNIAPHALFTFSPEQGTSGSLTVTHGGPYGSLVGKAVALEPATGFSFDTPLTYRPR